MRFTHGISIGQFIPHQVRDKLCPAVAAFRKKLHFFKILYTKSPCQSVIVAKTLMKAEKRMHSEKKLIQRMKNGDKDALRILYVEHKDFLLTLANALLHDIALAEDVVHDVFVTFTRNIGDFHLKGSLKSYFAACTANGARTLLRRKKIHAINTDFAAEPQAKQIPCPVETQETTERIRTHLAALPDDQREVVLLRIKAEMTFKEIARIQEVSIPTVQGRYRYGIDKLRSLLNGELQ